MAKLIATPNGEVSMFGNKRVGLTYSNEDGTLYTGKVYVFIAFLSNGERWWSDFFTTEDEAWDAVEPMGPEYTSRSASDADCFRCVNGIYRADFDYNFSHGNARVVIKDK